ncbi:hypothetical protein D1007_61055 [Hordeum vulgare]|nr:hypothetical protein D1007_61055 [Hordeum vulgare]
MANARRACVERRATRIAHTAPAGPARAHRSPSPVVNAATGPDAQEQQGSSQTATEQPDGRTATPSLVRASGSASRARPEMTHGRRTLAMDAVLLRYRPAPDRHKDWLQRVEELIAAVGDPVTLSCSFRPQPSLTNDANPGRGQEMKQVVGWFLGHAPTCTRSRRCKSRVASMPHSKETHWSNTTRRSNNSGGTHGADVRYATAQKTFRWRQKWAR